ncbi:MAG: hypothetical protein II824_02175 [Bacteroidales bacterium]|nr:hypothetical protein [Bacteroidales bacterium]
MKKFGEEDRIMKKIILSLLAAVSVFACAKNDWKEETEEFSFSIDFHIKSLDDVDTKVVKDSWENGDVISLFFLGLKNDKYIELQYDGSQWSASAKGNLVPGDLSGLSTKKLRGIYLPFGKDSWEWRCANYTWGYSANIRVTNTYSVPYSQRYYTYYMDSGILEFNISVEGNTAVLSVAGGELSMSIPSRYIQFFVEDENPKNATAALRVNHLVPSALTGLRYDSLELYESTFLSGLDNMYGAAIPGYAYEKGGKKGYIFSGLLEDSVMGNSSDFTFKLVKNKQAYSATVNNKTLNNRAVDITGLSWSEIPVEFVDLGLPSGTKWANMNLGAISESDWGNSFSWGDVTGYVNVGGEGRYLTTHLFDSQTYIYRSSSSSLLFSKYVESSQASKWGEAGDPDNKLQLDNEDDAAYAVNTLWHIPSKEQCEELVNAEYCNWEIDGLGYRVTSKIAGYTGNSIYIPWTEGFYGTEDIVQIQGHLALNYWTSTLKEDNSAYGYTLYSLYYNHDPSHVQVSSSSRYFGRFIRPVKRNSLVKTCYDE